MIVPLTTVQKLLCFQRPALLLFTRFQYDPAFHRVIKSGLRIGPFVQRVVKAWRVVTGKSLNMSFSDAVMIYMFFAGVASGSSSSWLRPIFRPIGSLKER